MRPQAIVYFERINLGTLVLGVLQSWLSWDRLVQMITSTGGSVATILITQGFSFALIIALTLFISRRRSKVAMWILVVFFVLGLPGLVLLIQQGLLLGSGAITALQTLGQFVALILLFTKPARRWMNREPELDLGDIFA